MGSGLLYAVQKMSSLPGPNTPSTGLGYFPPALKVILTHPGNTNVDILIVTRITTGLDPALRPGSQADDDGQRASCSHSYLQTSDYAIQQKSIWVL